MNLKRRIDRLEQQSGLGRGITVFRCIHPADWKGHLGPRCHRDGEIPPLSSDVLVAYQLNMGFCMHDRTQTWMPGINPQD